jgi:hypothetical protein
VTSGGSNELAAHPAACLKRRWRIDPAPPRGRHPDPLVQGVEAVAVADLRVRRDFERVLQFVRRDGEQRVLAEVGADLDADLAERRGVADERQAAIHP